MATKFTTFFSFKGGVGRSLTLSNVAYELSKIGRKVLIIDFDLEAPGQHHGDLFKGTQPNRGLVDIVTDFSKATNEEERLKYLSEFDLAKYLVGAVPYSLSNSDQKPGEISLLPAGSSNPATYRACLADLDWEKYFTNHGRMLIQEIKEQVRKCGFDHVLIDSRTGLTETFYITTLEFADTVILMSGLNRQNVTGIKQVYELLTSSAAISSYGERRIFLVGSPIPDQLPLGDIRRRLLEVSAEWNGFTQFDVQIPYVAELALSERLFCREADEVSQKNNYTNACSHLSELIDSDEFVTRIKHEDKVSNPFTVIRRDYLSEDDLIKYFVDPGGSVVRALNEFAPIIVEGTRGSGKTTLASIVSLDAKVAKLRETNKAISPDDFDQIGLYFRIDADFLRSFNPPVDMNSFYEKLFSQYLDLIIIRKALRSLVKIRELSYWVDERRLFKTLYAQFGEFESSREHSIFGFEDFIEEQITKIRFALNNPNLKGNNIVFAQPNVLMKLLVESLERQKTFEEKYFAIMLDEYENFLPYQQSIVNTRLKQTKYDDRVTWRLFVRSGFFLVNDTVTAQQKIEATHDYRAYSLDDISYEEFQRHIVRVADRHLELDPFFRSCGVTSIEHLLASMSDEEEALLIRNSRRELKPITDWVNKHHSAAAEIIMEYVEREPNFLRAVTAVVIMNQGLASKTNDKLPQRVIASFTADDSNAKNWYGNYKRGALFWLCTLYRRDKLFSGLNTLLGVSGKNTRYFLDFCHRIVERWISEHEGKAELLKASIPISVTTQDAAIREQAKEYRESVKGTDRNAKALYQFLERLGSILSAAHKSPRQSEPEINHFSIVPGDKLTTEQRDQLNTLIWDVVYEDILRRLDGNKQKSLRNARLDAWQLAPRFSPIFDLSTRRKKELQVTEEDLFTLLTGNDAQWGKLFGRYHRRFSSLAPGIDPLGTDVTQNSLFE